MPEFVERLDAMLKAQGKTRAWLSRQTGISQRTMINWKAEDRLPRGDELILIAKTLKQPVDLLLMGKVMGTDLELDIALIAEKLRHNPKKIRAIEVLLDIKTPGEPRYMFEVANRFDGQGESADGEEEGAGAP